MQVMRCVAMGAMAGGDAIWHDVRDAAMVAAMHGRDGRDVWRDESRDGRLLRVSTPVASVPRPGGEVAATGNERLLSHIAHSYAVSESLFSP